MRGAELRFRPARRSHYLFAVLSGSGPSRETSPFPPSPAKCTREASVEPALFLWLGHRRTTIHFQRPTRPSNLALRTCHSKYYSAPFKISFAAIQTDPGSPSAGPRLQRLSLPPAAAGKPLAPAALRSPLSRFSKRPLLQPKALH